MVTSKTLALRSPRMTSTVPPSLIEIALPFCHVPLSKSPTGFHRPWCREPTFPMHESFSVRTPACVLDRVRIFTSPLLVGACLRMLEIPVSAAGSSPSHELLAAAEIEVCILLDLIDKNPLVRCSDTDYSGLKTSGGRKEGDWMPRRGMGGGGVIR